MASVCPSMVIVPAVASIWSSTASSADCAAGVRSDLANSNNTSLGSLISTGVSVPAPSGPVLAQIKVLTYGSGPRGPVSTGSSLRAGDPAASIGTSTGCSTLVMNHSDVVSSGGAVNTAVMVAADPGAISSYWLSLTRPSNPSASCTS
jgi:hypothetical protein